MKKIAFFDVKQYDIASFDKFNGKDGLSFKYFETRLTPDTVQLARGFDGICVFVNDILNREVLEKLYEYGIKMLALRCAGFNNADLDYCHGKFKIFRVPAYSPYAVAEHAMALLLTSIRRIHKAYIRTRDFNFSLNNLTGFDLHGKTVGVIGTGKIGRVFIDICKGFGMKILAYDKFPSDSSDFEYVSLERLFSESDIISLHCPLTEETNHIINSESISKMKKGVVILNTSRGALIDAEALLEGIKERKIGAACLDVYEEEHDYFYQDRSDHIITDDNLSRLMSLNNVLITSHQAFFTKEAMNNIVNTTLQNVTDYFAGNELVNEVKPQ